MFSTFLFLFDRSSGVTRVVDTHMNQLLKNILNLIKLNVGSGDAPWMTRIAAYAQQIIVSCSNDLLFDPYLPLAEKVSFQFIHHTS